MRTISSVLLLFTVLTVEAAVEQRPGERWLELPVEIKHALLIGFAGGVEETSIVATFLAKSACSPGMQSFKEFWSLPVSERNKQLREYFKPPCGQINERTVSEQARKNILGSHPTERLAQQIDYFYTDPLHPEFKKIPWSYLVPLATRRLNGEDVTDWLKVVSGYIP